MLITKSLQSIQIASLSRSRVRKSAVWFKIDCLMQLRIRMFRNSLVIVQFVNQDTACLIPAVQTSENE